MSGGCDGNDGAVAYERWGLFDAVRAVARCGSDALMLIPSREEARDDAIMRLWLGRNLLAVTAALGFADVTGVF